MIDSFRSFYVTKQTIDSFSEKLKRSISKDNVSYLTENVPYLTKNVQYSTENNQQLRGNILKLDRKRPTRDRKRLFWSKQLTFFYIIII